MSIIEKVLPDFSKYNAAECERVAFEAINTYRAAITALEEAPASIEDFLIPFDEAEFEFDCAIGPVYTLISAVGGPDFDALEEKLDEPLTKLQTWMMTNEALYAKFVELSKQDLDAESAYMVSEQIKEFRLGGIDLDANGRKALEEADLKISQLATRYGQIVSKMLATPVSVDGREYTLNNFTNQLALAQLDDPTARAQLLAKSMERGFGGKFDTRGIVLEMARQRNARAKLLGFNNHAEVVLETEMAPSTNAVYQLLSDVSKAAVEASKGDEEELTRRAQADGLESFTASDWLYYQEKQKADVLGLSAQALKPYLEMWNVLENGVFFAANKIYGVSAKRRTDLSGWDPSMRVYEIEDEASKSLGIFLIDPFTRAGKSGGAWMDSLVQGYLATDYESIIINCANFEPVEDGPKFLVWDEVETLFHEFGHALHGFLSKTRYSSTAGTAVPRDFVELPSQLNEMWAYNPTVIENFARHFETGKVMPEQMRAQLRDSKTFGQAHATVEFCASALLDQAWYSSEISEDEDVAQFEAEALEKAGVASDLIPPRYRSTYFPHAFTVGYDAGYYSYMWAEALVAECENWFRTVAAIDGDGGLNRQAGRRITDAILSRGSSRDPRESFRELIGHDASAKAILSRRGL
ncbi:MAG: M3 family metallopeptidase [Actinomyces sp.]|uniref:M3 family metallopeptidase n=1 Tax=Actinomyces sp. TaxID=29317 RepID=UPI001EC1D4AB|nr:M3 family metallopeptidase [Actinomyces sp.]MBS5826167.1 M3 family metallopeptidase [Actinomyces sp.]